MIETLYRLQIILQTHLQIRGRSVNQIRHFCRSILTKNIKIVFLSREVFTYRDQNHQNKAFNFQMGTDMLRSLTFR